MHKVVGIIEYDHSCNGLKLTNVCTPIHDSCAMLANAIDWKPGLFSKVDRSSSAFWTRMISESIPGVGSLSLYCSQTFPLGFCLLILPNSYLCNFPVSSQIYKDVREEPAGADIQVPDEVSLSPSECIAAYDGFYLTLYVDKF